MTATKRLLAPLFALLIVVSVIGLLACEDEDVGIPCQMTQTLDAGTSSAQINPQAMDCRSRLCLLYGSGASPLCTRICESDGDCPDETEKCKEGFTCIPALDTTKLACCKMCVCKKFVAGEGGSTSSYCEQNPNPNCPDL
jgi:hypothetical protein